jgi:hypothetical protein
MALITLELHSPAVAVGAIGLQVDDMNKQPWVLLGV